VPPTADFRITMASRPMLSVQSTDGSSAEQIQTPYVFTAPLRPDLIEVRIPTGFYIIVAAGGGVTLTRWCGMGGDADGAHWPEQERSPGVLREQVRG
jgi:hypothetical protein